MGILNRKKKSAGSPSFVGDKEVKHFERGDDSTTVHFVDDTEAIINNELLDMILSDVKREGGVTDAVRHVLSAKFVSEMADLGLEYYMVENVTSGMGTLIHNLREVEIGKAFECTSGIDMKLSKLI